MSTKEKTDRKSQIREVAARLFKDRGYHATSIRDLADALEIEAASLYSHFRSKDELLWDIATRSSEDFFRSVEPIALSHLHTQKKLTDMIVAHTEVITRNMDAAAVFFYEWKHLDGERRAEYDAIRERYEDLFRNVIQQGVAENLFKHYDIRFSARTLLSALNWTHTWYRPDGDLKPAEIGEQLAGVLLHGLVRTM